jgi:hypothetical protein
VPGPYKDDPTRTVLAAMEIHAFVKSLSYDYEALVKAPLTMHAEINTGLVVTAEVDPGKGTHGVAEDEVNVAARLRFPGDGFGVGLGSTGTGEDPVRLSDSSHRMIHSINYLGKQK